MNIPKNNAQYRIIEEGAQIGESTSIWNFTHVRSNAKIGNNCNIGNNVYIDARVSIGNNVKIQNTVNVYHGVTIEDDVFVGPSVAFTNDLVPRAFIWGEEKIIPTLVKRGASIGSNATIKCGITLGEYCLVGAGSVVTKDVPAYTLVIGSPARIVGIISPNGKIYKSISLEVISEEKEGKISLSIEGEEFIVDKNIVDNLNK